MKSRRSAHRPSLGDLGVNGQRSAWLAWGSTVAVFIAAFLLFQIQPMVAKIILPWFGGGASVWTACMLFFQVLLLGGYVSCSFRYCCSGATSTLTILHACDRPVDRRRPMPV